MTIKKGKLEVLFRAEDDRYWSSTNPVTGTSLKDEGYESYDLVDGNHQPNLKKLILPKVRDNLLEIATLLEKYDVSQKRILMRVIHDSLELKEETGFRFMQPVYWKASSPGVPECLDQWAQCYVLALSWSYDQTVYLTTEYKKDPMGLVVESHTDYILSRKDFKEHKAKLVKKGMIHTPERLRRHSVLCAEDMPSEDEQIKKWMPNLANFREEQAYLIAEEQVLSKEKKASDRSKVKVSGVEE